MGAAGVLTSGLVMISAGSALAGTSHATGGKFALAANHMTVKPGADVLFTGTDTHYQMVSRHRIYCLVQWTGRHWNNVTCDHGAPNRVTKSVMSRFAVKPRNAGKYTFRADLVNPRTHRMIQAPTKPVTITVKK
jgi:hypothetical protein